MTAVQTKTKYMARIHPREPSRGYLARNVIVSGSGYPKFQVTRGWYEVDESIIPKLKAMLNHPEDPHSRPIFQICTEEEALALEKAEMEEAAKATAPIPIPGSRKRKLKIPVEKRPKPKLPERLREEEDEPVVEDEPERPAFHETADPDDPEDHEFMDEDEWPDDLAPTQEEVEANPPPALKNARADAREEAQERKPRRAKKKVAKKTKKVAKKATKKTARRAKKKS